MPVVTSLKFSISGVRGIYPDDLDETLVKNLIAAYAHWNTGKTIVLAFDTRHSSENLKQVASDTLKAFGKKVIDIGIVPTPSVQVYVTEKKLDGGIMITASHNPGQFNGVKMIHASGVFLDQTQVDAVFALYADFESGKKKIPTNDSEGSVILAHDGIQTHIRKIKKHFDLKSIAQRRPKVVVDPVNGAGCIANILFLKELGCEVTSIHDQPQGDFEREPEPLAKNIGALMSKVKSLKGVNIGFALDVDADRLAIVDENGNALGEDLTLCLAVKAMLAQRQGQPQKVVTNLSTTQALKDVCDEFGAELILTPIGEINVSKKIIESNAWVGGEGNGGVIIPSIGYGRDSLAGMAVILKYLCDSQKTISHLAKEIPHYEVIKDKVDASKITDLQGWFGKLEQEFKEAEINRADGVKFTFDDSSWVHVRSSNTEPIVRVYAEAKQLKRAQALVDTVLGLR